MKKYTVALTIAGSDSSSSAGIQADLKTFAALGCYGASVITLLTAQNTQKIQDFLLVPTRFVRTQLNSIFSDIKVDAIKTGMLLSASTIKAVAESLASYPAPLVVDPVMVNKKGTLLLKQKAINSLSKKLLPLAAILTPNINEAEHLLKRSIKNKHDMEQAAKELCNMGPKAVLIKGGRLNTAGSDDCLYIKKEKKFYWFKAKRINTNNIRGTGCTLSSAITTFLAQGNNLVDSVAYAKNYITKSLIAGRIYSLGSGPGPVHHFHETWS